MSNALQQLLKLSEQDRLALLRNIVEGVYSPESIINAISMNQLGRLQEHAGLVSRVNRSLDQLTNSVSKMIEVTPSQAGLILEQYKQLPLLDRLGRCAGVQNQIERFVGTNSPLYFLFKKTNDKDLAVMMAVDMLVQLYVKQLYSIPNISTKNVQVPALRLMAPCNHSVSMGLPPAVTTIINGFRRMYHALVQSLLSDELKECIRFLTERMIIQELTQNAPLNKKKTFLYMLKNRLAAYDLQQPPGWFSLNKAKTWERIEKLRQQLGCLIESNGLSSCSAAEDESTEITRLFHSTQSIIAEEIADRSLFKNENWVALFASFNVEIQAILTDDTEVAQPIGVGSVAFAGKTAHPQSSVPSQSREIQRETLEAPQAKVAQPIATVSVASAGAILPPLRPAASQSREARDESARRQGLLHNFDIAFSALESEVLRQGYAHGRTILAKLQILKNQFCDLTIDQSQFTARCEQHINNCLRSDFAKQPVWKELLYGLAFCIASLASLGVANVVSYALTGSLRFFVVPDNTAVTRASGAVLTTLTAQFG